MNELLTIDGSNWKEHIQSPLAVLILGKTDCEKCRQWSEELTAFLAEDSEFTDVKFGKMLLDQRGLGEFKKANTWIAELDVLPFNLLYVKGEKVKEYAGGGLERLQNRLRRLAEADA